MMCVGGNPMYIYKTTNLLNGKIYVGQSKFNPEDNPTYLGSGCLLIRAVRCYGSQNFRKEILELCDNKDQLCELERYWIATLKSNVRGVGYNICEGGTWGDTFSSNPRAEELRTKFRELNGGQRNPNYGNRWTTEQRLAASRRCKRTNRIIDKETGLNVAKLPHVRRKISDTKKGLLNPQAFLWRLISPINEEFLIEGGVKDGVKRFGVDYQQFRRKVGDNIRVNRAGWMLIRVPAQDARFHQRLLEGEDWDSCCG